MLIHGNDTVRLNNIKEFIPIDDDWGKTRKFIINGAKILYDADVATFKVVNSFQGKDKNFNFEFGTINENDLKKASFKTFDFRNKDLCQIAPTVFTDVYDSLVSYIEDKNKPIKIVEKLKQIGFTLNNTTYLDGDGETKIIRTSLTGNKCNYIVEKHYDCDYGKPYEEKYKYIVTERIYRNPR